MKDKRFEYRVLANRLIEQQNLTNTDIGVSSNLLEHVIAIKILSWGFSLGVGFFSCVFFDINFWYMLLIAFCICFAIDLYVYARKNAYINKMSNLTTEQKHLQQICEEATKFSVGIELKNAALAKKDKQIDLKKAKSYGNDIVISKFADGWEFFGLKPIYYRKDLRKKREVLFVSARDEFIKSGQWQQIVFPLPEAKGTKQVLARFKLYADNEVIKFYPDKSFDFSDINTRRFDVEHITILLMTMRHQIYERIINAFQPYNDNINAADKYWAKKYLFKSDNYRKEQLNKLYTERSEYENSLEFYKLKYAPFGEEKTYTNCACGGVCIDEEPNPKHKIKYRHIYHNNGRDGASHIFETDSFIIEITQN